MDQHPELAPQYSDAHELSKQPDVRILGSLARASIMQLDLPEVSDQGVRRNINAFHMSPGNYLRYGSTHVSFGSSTVSTRYDQWIRTDEQETRLTFPVDPEVYVAVPYAEEVFQRHEITLGSVAIATVLPEVMTRMNELMLVKRPKDKKNFAVYEQYLQSHHVNPVLDPSLLDPFDEFAEQLRTQRLYRLKGVLMYAYHRTVSHEKRTIIDISRRLRGISPIPRFDELRGE